MFENHFVKFMTPFAKGDIVKASENDKRHAKNLLRESKKTWEANHIHLQKSYEFRKIACKTHRTFAII